MSATGAARARAASAGAARTDSAGAERPGADRLGAESGAKLKTSAGMTVTLPAPDGRTARPTVCANDCAGKTAATSTAKAWRAKRGERVMR